MSSKTIGVQEEVWKKIKERKRPGQSYSGYLAEELELEVDV
ncbi:MAG: hypothetical protein ABEJ83_01095 [Candidatus Nanohaloarchaea archaeon]